MTAKSILVVDYDVSARQVLRDFFESEGFKVFQATDGEDALKMTSKKRFDVVLTELKMPGLGGLDVLREIRRSHTETVVVIFTEYPSAETAQKAWEMGCDAYITKPMNLEQLEQVISRNLAQRRWAHIAGQKGFGKRLGQMKVQIESPKIVPQKRPQKK